MTDQLRTDGRAFDALRPVTIQRHYTRHAEGSVLVAFGDTKVLCTASVEDKVPPHKRGSGEGWVTAEYGMLPRATHTRGDREAARGKQSGRTQEIQRLIGRSLRCVFDLAALGERSILIDCDVLQADGGTRTAAITGAWVAAYDAASWLCAQRRYAQRCRRDLSVECSNTTIGSKQQRTRRHASWTPRDARSCTMVAALFEPFNHVECDTRRNFRWKR